MSGDRTSNGPHIYYPAPHAPGGTGAHEDWVLGNFSDDPYAKCGMIDTAETVARKWQITTEEQHDVVLRRYEQYEDAVAEDRAFQKRYMTLPLDVPDARYRKTAGVLEGDEGIHATTREGLDRLRPVNEDGTVTYAGQTHPADGNAGFVVTGSERARALSQRRRAFRSGSPASAPRGRRCATCRKPRSAPPAARSTTPGSRSATWRRSRPTTRSR